MLFVTGVPRGRLLVVQTTPLTVWNFFHYAFAQQYCSLSQILNFSIER